jgi:hypothetical protein
LAISNDNELRAAVAQAGALLQEIQRYVGRDPRHDARVRFPRGFLRTAAWHRQAFDYIDDVSLKDNLAYTMILSDTVHWLLTRTDIMATAREMLIKLFVFLVGTMAESVTKHYLKGHCGRGYRHRTAYLLEHEIITEALRDDLDWLWQLRNRMHLFGLDKPEYTNDYNEETLTRSKRTLNSLSVALRSHGELAG